MLRKTKQEKQELAIAKRTHERFKRNNPEAYNTQRQEVVMQIASNPAPNWGNLTIGLIK